MTRALEIAGHPGSRCGLFIEGFGPSLILLWFGSEMSSKGSCVEDVGLGKSDDLLNGQTHEQILNLSGLWGGTGH